MARKPPPLRAARQEPMRTEPLRGPAAKPAPQSRKETPNRRPPDDDVGDIIADAVRAGYEVVHENLRQGRLAADRHKAGQYRLDDIPDDVSAFVQRMVDLSRDLAATGFDLIEAILRDPRLLEAVAQRNIRTKRENTGRPRGSALPKVKVELTGQRALVVHQSPLAAPPDGRRVAPYLQSLAPLTGAAPPIRGSLSWGEEEEMVVRVHVPDHQPAGTYQGAVVDRADDTVLMALAIRVMP